MQHQLHQQLYLQSQNQLHLLLKQAQAASYFRNKTKSQIAVICLVSDHAPTIRSNSASTKITRTFSYVVSF